MFAATTTGAAHPSDNMLNEYCHGDEDFTPVIENHLQDCDFCRIKVVRMIRECVQGERGQPRPADLVKQ